MRKVFLTTEAVALLHEADPQLDMTEAKQEAFNMVSIDIYELGYQQLKKINPNISQAIITLCQERKL